MSDKLEDFMLEFVTRHEPGNPQLRLDRLISQATIKCELCGQPANHLWHVLYVSGKVLRSCKLCIEEKQGKRLVKKVLRLV